MRASFKKMKKVKLSRLYWTIVISLYVYCVEGYSLCTRISLEVGVPEFETLCDLEFCTCHDPYGRVKCICPTENPQEELFIRSKGSCAVPYGTTSLSIENCNKVTVILDTFQDLQDLQNLKLQNIKEVSLEGGVYPTYGPPRTFVFVNTTIPDIPSHTFTGNIHSVLFENCYIGVIRSFAFSSIYGADSIAFRDTNVANVEAQSFKKFSMNKFLIIDSQFNVIPSRFVFSVEVETLFKIQSTFIETIRTLGFNIKNPKKVILVDSMINNLHSEAFKIESTGDIVFSDSIFTNIDNEAFRGVTLNRTAIQQIGKPKFKLQNVTVTNLQPKSLYFNRSVFEGQISKLMIDEVCTCDGLMSWKEMITIGKKPLESIEIELEPIWCHLDDKKEGNFDYVPGREFYREHCNKLTSSIYFFVIIISTTAVCLAITISIIVCCMRRKKKKWQPVPLTARESNGVPAQRKTKSNKKNNKSGNREVIKPENTKAIIVPDGRTYKETEFHIIVEKAEPLDDCIPCTIVRDRSRSQIN